MKPSHGGSLQFLTVILIAGVCFWARVAKANLSGSSASYTGAPGESTCTACHVQTTRTGFVSLTGAPTTYSPGATYGMTVTVNTTGVRYGFEMTAIDSAGNQAGNLQPTTVNTQNKTGIVGANTRQYIEHTSTGNSFSNWTFNWIAPSAVAGPITFYVAGLRANNDVNTTSDTTYTTNKTSAAPAPPANDAFASGQALSGNSGAISSTNNAATKEVGEPNHAGNAGGASVWYSWIAPSSGGVAFDTSGSGFDTLLAAYTGSSVGGTSLVASNNNTVGLTSRIVFNATAATQYRIAVDGVSGASGNFTLSWMRAVTNDNFSNTVVLAGLSGSVTSSNVAGTKELGEPNHAGNSGGGSVWFRWTAPAGNGVVTLDTKGSDFDTLLAVYSGNSVSSLTTIASDDQSGGNNTSALAFGNLAGTVYQIAVDGFNGARGKVIFNWSVLPPPNLFITQSPTNTIVFSWPVSPPGFTLESVSLLSPAGGWTSVTNPVTTVGNQNMVVHQNLGATRFFRLRRP